jgi:hypothetical protein
VLGSFGGAGAKAVVKLVRQPLPTDDLQALIAAVTLASRAPYRRAERSYKAAPNATACAHAAPARAWPCRSGMEYGYYVGTTPRYGMLSVDVLCPDAIPGALRRRLTRRDALALRVLVRSRSPRPQTRP